MAVNTIGILIGIVWLLAQLAIIGAIVYLFVLIVKALKKYIGSKEVREEKREMRLSRRGAARRTHPLQDDAGICRRISGRESPGYFKMGKWKCGTFDIKFAGARKIVWRRCRGASGACGERRRLIVLAFGDGRTLFSWCEIWC